MLTHRRNQLCDDVLLDEPVVVKITTVQLHTMNDKGTKALKWLEKRLQKGRGMYSDSGRKHEKTHVQCLENEEIFPEQLRQEAEYDIIYNDQQNEWYKQKKAKQQYWQSELKRQTYEQKVQIYHGNQRYNCPCLQCTVAPILDSLHSGVYRNLTRLLSNDY